MIKRKGRRRVAAQWKIAEHPARARLTLLHRDACNHEGKPMLCECGKPLDAWDFMKEMERPKTVLCCRNPKCNNSAQTTARILSAELRGDDDAEEEATA